MNKTFFLFVFYLLLVILTCYQLYFHPDEDGCILQLFMVKYL